MFTLSREAKSCSREHAMSLSTAPLSSVPIWVVEAEYIINQEGTMKRFMVIALAVSLAVVPLLAGVSYAQQKAAPYVLGIVLDMTGRQSNLGIGMKRGMDIALAEVNAAGGVN